MTEADERPLRLPDIALSELPEATKDFILASTHGGRSAADVIREVLTEAATDAGFPPGRGEPR